MAEDARVIPLPNDGARSRRAASGASGGATDGPGGAVVPFGSAAPSTDTATDLERRPAGWESAVAETLAFVRRRLAGEYEVDEYGYDSDFTEHVAGPALAPLYERWLRVDVAGIENIPAEGGALLVANHAGCVWALDATMATYAVRREHPQHRALRVLGADLVFRTPGLSALARRFGSTLACMPDAQRLLTAGELVGVFPEGFKGIGKPFSQRYRLQRFGRGGFVQAAISTGVPIVPVSIVGSEESYPMLANVKSLARALNLPYFPITPTFPLLGAAGLVPLPAKWHIEFGAPMPTDHLGAAAAEDPAIVFELTDRVRESIQESLFRLLSSRRSIWR